MTLRKRRELVHDHLDLTDQVEEEKFPRSRSEKSPDREPEHGRVGTDVARRARVKLGRDE